MFNKDVFINQCKEIAHLDDSHKRIKLILDEALKDPESIMKALGRPTSAGVEALYEAPNLSILNFVWAPGMELHPHNHNLWAIIGIYTGVEENTFYVRKDDEIVKQNSKNISTGNAMMLGKDVIHSVKNPSTEFTGGIHIYGGNFVGVERSQWDKGPREESPYNMDQTRQLFADANSIISQ